MFGLARVQRREGGRRRSQIYIAAGALHPTGGGEELRGGVADPSRDELGPAAAQSPTGGRQEVQRATSLQRL